MPAVSPTTACPMPVSPLQSNLETRIPAGSARWLFAFIGLLILCQLALLSPMLGNIRLVVRIAVFGTSLAFLLSIAGRGRWHPAAHLALVALAIVGLAFVHPHSNSALASLAQLAMYLAIFAPLFWVPRLRLSPLVLRYTMMILWGFHSLSAAFGVLQVYFPGRFQPSLSTMITGQGPGYVNQLYITMADGQRVLRPMGLTDIPGGAAMAGFYAVLFGIGLLLTERSRWFRAICVASMMVGMVCIYLSQVRSVLVMLSCCFVGFLVLLAWRREKAKLATMTGVLAGVSVLSLLWAISLGGDSLTRRLNTLVAKGPTEVYYSNRGLFLEHTINELAPQYPLGAGLARWGMMDTYFGENRGPERRTLWAEIQWTGWLLDGGLPLVLAYLIAFFLAVRIAWRIASLRQAGDIWLWGMVLLGYNFGAIAATFNSTFFMSQGGLEFWLLNAVVFGTAQSLVRPKPTTVEAPA